MTVGMQRRVGGCRLIGPIGVGASSTVYRGIDDETGQEVAVKVLAENHSLLAEMRQRFLDEVDLLSAIDSPDIAQVHRAGETDEGQLYMILDLADRGDVGQRVDELRAAGTAIGNADVLALARHLERSLSALHEVGIVHRDVTPGNVLISRAADGGLNRGLAILAPSERFLLADLGLAKDLAFASGITAGSGTPGFAAPEQAAQVAVVDHRADVFGATAMVKWLLGPDDLPPFGSLTSFIDTGLAPAPDARFDSMATWLESLESALSAPIAKAPHGRRSRPAMALGVGAVVIGIGLLGLGASELVDDGAIEQTTTTEREGDGRSTTAVTAASSTTGSVDENEPGLEREAADEPIAGSTITTLAPAGTGPSAPSTQPATTAVDPPPSGPTTTDPKLREAPRAYLVSPAPDAIVTGDLALTGTARYIGGVEHVELTIKNEDTGQFWNPSTGAFQLVWLRFEVPVSTTAGTDVTWSYQVPEEALTPGRHRLRVWARATAGNGDPVSDVRYITISG